MTKRQQTVLDKLHQKGTATIDTMAGWLDCHRTDALVTLGIMSRVGQIHRVSATPEGKSIWSWRPNP